MLWEETAKNLFRVLILFSTLLFCFDHNFSGAAAQAATDSRLPQQDANAGWTAFQTGALEQAVGYWLKAAQVYQDQQKPREQTEVLVHLAHAYRLLGQFKNGTKSLAVALILAEKSGDGEQLALVYDGLGNLYLASGPEDKASHYLAEAMRLAREIGNRRLLASILNSWGNLATLQKKYVEAVDAYSQSGSLAAETASNALAARAWINAGKATIQTGDGLKTTEFLRNGLSHARKLNDSSDKVYTLINAALIYSEVSRLRDNESSQLLALAGKTLSEAIHIAGTIGDLRGESYALGHLATFYEKERRYDEALALSRKAVFAVQQIQAPETLYRWEWQIGRLLKARGNIEDAIFAYRRAVRTLQSIRQEIAATYGASRSSFRDAVGPVYFELVDLLLQHPTVLGDREQSQTFLVEARDTLELFKAAELRDYFRDDCVDAARARITKLDIVTPKAIVVYPIVLPDRLELLISLPAGLKRIMVPVTANVLAREVREFRKKLEKRTTNEFLPHAQLLYRWIVAPLENHLDSLSVETLVFVPDGALRTIPMAALHDGKQFLIAKYPLAITPGLDLTDPQPLRRDKIKVLAVGLTESVQGFPELPYVAGEIDSIQQIYGGQSLINKDYLVPRVEKELKENPFNVVHVASHGEFSSDFEKTFLLTFDGKLTMDRLDQYVGLFRFRDDPLELLTLSACETAAGDDRAALGLAGIAIKAGARSALASLWFINDQATSMLIEEFYRQLRNPSVSRALALQRAQFKLLDDIRYQHPGYWSAFLLINNWL